MQDRQFTIWKAESTEYCKLRVTFGPSKRWFFLSGPYNEWFGVRDGTWNAMEHKTEILKIDKFLFLANGRRIFSCRKFGKYGERAPVNGQEGAKFMIKSTASFPETKRFRIKVTAQAARSWSIPVVNASAQREWIFLKVEDLDERDSATYSYSGAGLAPDFLGVAAKKGAKLMGAATETIKKVDKALSVAGSVGGSAEGPWNDFEAPGWMSVYDFTGAATAGTVYSAGMGTSKSWNTFQFGGNDGMLIEIMNFSTGASYSMPQAAAFTTGKMSLDT